MPVGRRFSGQRCLSASEDVVFANADSRLPLITGNNPHSCAVHPRAKSIQSEHRSDNRAPIRARDHAISPDRSSGLSARGTRIGRLRGDHHSRRRHHPRFRGRDDGGDAGRLESGPRERSRGTHRWRAQRAHPERPHPRLQIRNPRAAHEESVADRQRSQLQLEATSLQRDRARESDRLALVPPQREGRMAALRRWRVSERRRGRRDPRQHRHSGNERTDAGAYERRPNLEQQLFVQLRTRDRAVQIERQLDHAQSAGLRCPWIQRRVLSPRTGCRRSAHLRAEQQERRCLQLDDARRRRRYSSGPARARWTPARAEPTTISST